MADRATLEQQTGDLFGGLWGPYDQQLFEESVDLFFKRLDLAGVDREWFAGKDCLDAGCGGGRNTIAMGRLNAASAVGVDLGEKGLQDARRRAEGMPNVQFQQASVLDLPFADNAFDLVWCAGVLMHTANEDLVLDELARVVKPGGKLYLLVYATGGMRWPLIKLLRPLAAHLGEAAIERALELAESPANKRRTFLDDLFCPTFDFFHWDRLHRMLDVRGFGEVERWGKQVRLDHESDLTSYRTDLAALLVIFEAGSGEAFPAERALFEEGRSMVQATVNTIRWFETAVDQGQMTAAAAMDRVIGQGHHRLLATKG